MSSTRNRDKRKPRTDKTLASSLQQAEERAQQTPAVERDPATHTAAGLQDAIGNQAVLDAISGTEQQGLTGAAADTLSMGIAGVDTQEMMPGTGSMSVMRAMLHAELRERAGIEPPDASLINRIGRRRGRPLPPAVRARMEQAFDHDFDHVRVHTDPQAGRTAEQLEARAFADGADIWFGPGEFAPDTPRGEQLLAHELAHVVQADQGRLPSAGSGLQVSDPSDRSEQEADTMARMAVAKMGAPLDVASAPARMPVDEGWSQAPIDTSMESLPLVAVEAGVSSPAADASPASRAGAKAAGAKAMRKAKGGPGGGKRKKKQPKGKPSPKSFGADDVAGALAGVIAKMLPSEEDEQQPDGSAPGPKDAAQGKAGGPKGEAGGPKGKGDGKPGGPGADGKEKDKQLTPQETLRQVLTGQAPPPALDDADFSADQLGKAILAIPGDDRERLGAIADKDPKEPTGADDLLDLLGPEVLQQGATALQKAIDGDAGELLDQALGDELLPLDLQITDLAGDKLAGPKDPDSKSQLPGGKPGTKQTKEPGQLEPKPGADGAKAKGQVGEDGKPKDGDDSQATDEDGETKATDQDAKAKDGDDKNKKDKDEKKKKGGKKGGSESDKMSQKEIRAEIKRLTILKDYAGIDLEFLDLDMTGKQLLMGSKQENIAKIQGKLDRNQDLSDKRQKLLQGKAKSAQDSGQQAPGPDDDSNMRFLGQVGKRLPIKMQGIQKKVTIIQTAADKIAGQQEDKQQEIADLDERIAELQSKLKSGGGGAKGPEDWPKICEELNKQLEKKEKQEKKDQEADEKAAVKLDEKLKQLDKDILGYRTDKQDAADSKGALETELGEVKGQITARKKAISDEAAANAAADAAAAKNDPKGKTKTKTKKPKAKAPNPATDKTVKTLGKQQKTIEKKIKKAEREQQKAEKAEKQAKADKKKAEEELKKKKEAIKERTKTFDEMADAKKNLADGIDVPHIYSERFGLELKMYYYPFGHRPWTMGDRGKSKADLEKLNEEYQKEMEAKREAAKKAQETGQRTLGDATGTDAAAQKAAQQEARRKKDEERNKKPLSADEQAKVDAEEAKKKEDILLRKASNYQDLAPDKREEAMKALAEAQLLERDKKLKRPLDPAAVNAEMTAIKSKLDNRVKAVGQAISTTKPFTLEDGTVVDLSKGPIPDSLILNPEVAKKVGVSVEDLKRHKEQKAREAFAKKAREMMFGKDSQVDPQTAVDMLHKYGGERKMSPQQMLDHLTFAGAGSLPPELQAAKSNVDAFNQRPGSDFLKKYGTVPVPKVKYVNGRMDFTAFAAANNKNIERMAELEKRRTEAGKIETTLASNKKIAANIGVKTPDEADAYVKTLMETCQIPEAEARRRMEAPGDPNITSSPLPATEVAARMRAIRLMPAGKARSAALKDLTDTVPPKFMLGALLRQSEDGVGIIDPKQPVANPQLQKRIQEIEKLPKDQQYNAYRNLAKMTDMPVHELRLSTHNKTKKDAVLNDASRVMNDPKLSKEERDKKMAEMAKAHKLTKEQFQAAYDKTIKATEEALNKYRKKIEVGFFGREEDDPTTKAINELARHDLDPDELERKIQEVSRLTGVSPADLRRYSGFKSLETAKKDMQERVNMGPESYDKLLEQGRKYSPAKTPQEMIEHLRNVPWDQVPKELRWAKQEIGKFDYRNPGKDKGVGADLAMYRKKAKLRRGETFERLETDPAKILKMPANTVAEAEAKKKAWDEYVSYTKKRDRLISKLDETIVEDDDAYKYLKAMSSKERAALLNDPGAHDEDSARIKASFLDGCDGDPYHTWGKRMFEQAAYYNEALDKGVQEKADKAAQTAADDEKRRRENEAAAKLLADPDTQGKKKGDPVDIQDVNAHVDNLCRVHGWTRKQALANLKKAGSGEGAVKLVSSMYTMKDGEPSKALKWELDRVNKLPDAERARSMSRLQKWSGLKTRDIKKAQGKLTIQNHVVKTLAAAEQLPKGERDKILRKLAEDLGKKDATKEELAEIEAMYKKAKAEGLDKIHNTPGFQNHIKSLDECAPGDLARKVAEVAKATGLSKDEVMRFAQGRRHAKVEKRLTDWVAKDKGGVDGFKAEAHKRNMTLEEFANYLSKANPKDIPQHLRGIQGRIKKDADFPAQWTEAETKARKKAMGDPDDPGYRKKKNELIAQLMGDCDDDKILNAFGSMSMAERKLFIEEWNAMRAAGGRVGNQSMPDLREAFYDALQCDDEDRGIALLNAAEKFDREDALKAVNTEDNSDYSKKRNELLDEMQSPYGPNAWRIKKIFKKMTPAERAQFMRDQDDLINAANKEVEQKMRKGSEVPKRISAYLSNDHEFQVMVGDADKARRADFTFEQRKKTQAIEKKVEQTDRAVQLLNWKGDRSQAWALVEQMSKKYELTPDNMLRLLAGERLVDESSKIPAAISRRLKTPKSRGGGTVAAIAKDAMRAAGHDPDAAVDADVTGPDYGGKLAGFKADVKKVTEKQAKLQKFLSGAYMSHKDVVDIIYGCNPRELSMLDDQLPGGLRSLMDSRKNRYGRAIPGVQGEKAIELRALIKKAEDYRATAKEDQLVLDLKDMDPRKSADISKPGGLAARLAWAKDLPPDQRLAELNKLGPMIAKQAKGNPAEAITKAFLRGTIAGEGNVVTGAMAHQVKFAASLPKKERDEFLKQLAALGGYDDGKKLEAAAKKSTAHLEVAAEYQKALAMPAGAERIEKIEKILDECELSESELDRVLAQAEENGMLKKPVKPIPAQVSSELDTIKEIADPKERQAKLKELARLWNLSVPDLVAHVNKKADEARKQRELKGKAAREADDIRRKIKKGDEDEIKKIIEKYGRDPEHFKLILEQYPEGAAKLKKALKDEFGANDPECVDLLAIIDRAEKFTPKPELPDGVSEDVSKELQDIMRRFPTGDAKQNENRKQAIAQFKLAKGLNDGDMAMVSKHAEHQVKYFDEELERHKKALDAEVNGSWLWVSDDRIAEIVKRIPHDMLVALAEKYPKLMKATLDGIGGDVYDDVKHKLDTGRMAQKLPFEQRKKEISKARVSYKAEKLRDEFDAWFTVDRSRIRELLEDCTPEEMRMLDLEFDGRLQQELDEAMKPTLFECAVAVVAVAALVVAAVLVPGVGATLLVGALAAASALGGTGTLYGLGRDADTQAIKGRIGAAKTDPQGNYELNEGKVNKSVEMLQDELNSTLWVSDSALYGALARLNPRELMSLRERMNKPPPQGIQITDSDGKVLTLEGLIQKHISGDEKAKAVAMLADANDHVNKRDRRTELKEVARDLVIKDRMAELRRDPRHARKSPQEIYKLAVADKTLLNNKIKERVKKVKDSANTLFKAIDGWGDDEKTVLKTLAGLSPEEIDLVKVEYRRHFGKDLETQMREDMGLGDWQPGQHFEPGGWWTSHFTDQNEGRIALMMMNKTTRVEGLREFMLEYSERAWGDDEDLIYQTLENMSTEERTKLVSGPEGRDFLERVKEDLADNERHMVDALTVIDPKTGKAELNKAAVAAAKIKIAMHGSGAGWDFSSWGTDEDDLLKALDDLTPAQVQEAMKYYNEHLSDGGSFMADIADEMSPSSPEYKVVEAESRGDKVAADTYRLDYAADGWGTDEKLIEDTLRAGREGRGGRAKDHLKRLTKRFDATFGQKGDEYHDSKGTGQSALQIMLGDEMDGLERVFFEQLAEKGEADPELELLYSMHGAGTDEERAKKVMKRVNKMSPEARAAFIRRFEALSVDVLGVDETLEQWIEGDFSGSEGFEMKLMTMGPPRTPEEYLERARMRYDFERSGFINSIGNGFMDGLEALGAHSHGELLNQHMAEIEEMFDADGKLIEPGAFEDLKELCDWQEQDAKNYREVRDKATDYVVTAIQAIGAVVCMIIPGGQAFSAAWIAYLVKFAASMAVTAVSMMAKQALSGNGYGWEQAGIDLAQGVLEAATAGLGGMREFQKAAAGAMAAAKGLVAEGAEQGFKKLAKESLEEAITGGAQSLISGVITSEAVWEGGGEDALFTHLLKETAMGALKSGAMTFVGAGMKKTPWGKKLEDIEKEIASGGTQASFLKQYGLKYVNEVATAAVGTALDHTKWEAWARGEGFDGTLLKGLFIDPAWKSALQTSIGRSTWKQRKEAAGELANAQSNLKRYKQMLQDGDSDIDNSTLRRLIAGTETTISEKSSLIKKIDGEAVDELREQVEDKERQIADGRKQLRGKEIDPDEIGSKTEHVAIRREVEEGMDALEDQTRTVRRRVDSGDLDGTDEGGDTAPVTRRVTDDTSSDTGGDDSGVTRKTRKPDKLTRKGPEGEADSDLAETPRKRTIEPQELEDGTQRFVVFDNYEQVAGKKAAIIGAKAIGDDGEFSPALKAKLEKLGYTVRKNNVIARADTGAQVPLHLEDGRVVAGLKVSGKSKTPTHLANELLPGGSRGEIWKRAKGMVGTELTTEDGRVVKVAKVVPAVVREGVDSEGQTLTDRRIAIVTEDGQTLYRPVSDFQDAPTPGKAVAVKTADDVETKPVVQALARGDTSELTGGDPAAATQVFGSPAVRKAVNKHFEEAPDAPAERRKQVRNLLDGFGGDFMAAHQSFDTNESKAVKRALNEHRGRLVGSLMAEVQEAFPGLKVKARRLDPNSPTLTFEFEGGETAHARAFLEQAASDLFGGSLKKSLGVELSEGPVRLKQDADVDAAGPRRVEGEFNDPISYEEDGVTKYFNDGKGGKWGYSTSFGFAGEIADDGAFVVRQKVILVSDDVDDPAVQRVMADVHAANATYYNDPKHRIVVDDVERPLRQELDVEIVTKDGLAAQQSARKKAAAAAAAETGVYDEGVEPTVVNIHKGTGRADSSNLYTEGPETPADDSYRQMVIAHEFAHAIWGLADRYEDGARQVENPNYNPATDPPDKQFINIRSESRKAASAMHVSHEGGLMEDFNVAYAQGKQAIPAAKSWEDLAHSSWKGLKSIYDESNQQMPVKSGGAEYDWAMALKRLNPHLANEDGSFPATIPAGAEVVLPKLTAAEGFGVSKGNLEQLSWHIAMAKQGRVKFELGDGSEADRIVQAEKNKVYAKPDQKYSKGVVRKAKSFGFDMDSLSPDAIDATRGRSKQRRGEAAIAKTRGGPLTGMKGEVAGPTDGTRPMKAVKPPQATEDQAPAPAARVAPRAADAGEDLEPTLITKRPTGLDEAEGATTRGKATDAEIEETGKRVVLLLDEIETAATLESDPRRKLRFEEQVGETQALFSLIKTAATAADSEGSAQLVDLCGKLLTESDSGQISQLRKQVDAQLEAMDQAPFFRNMGLASEDDGVEVKLGHTLDKASKLLGAAELALDLEGDPKRAMHLQQQVDETQQVIDLVGRAAKIHGTPGADELIGLANRLILEDDPRTVLALRKQIDDRLEAMGEKSHFGSLGRVAVFDDDGAEIVSALGNANSLLSAYENALDLSSDPKRSMALKGRIDQTRQLIELANSAANVHGKPGAGQLAALANTLLFVDDHRESLALRRQVDAQLEAMGLATIFGARTRLDADDGGLMGVGLTAIRMQAEVDEASDLATSPKQAAKLKQDADDAKHIVDAVTRLSRLGSDDGSKQLIAIADQLMVEADPTKRAALKAQLDAGLEALESPAKAGKKGDAEPALDDDGIIVLDDDDITIVTDDAERSGGRADRRLLRALDDDFELMDLDSPLAQEHAKQVLTAFDGDFAAARNALDREDCKVAKAAIDRQRGRMLAGIIEGAAEAFPNLKLGTKRKPGADGKLLITIEGGNTAEARKFLAYKAEIEGMDLHRSLGVEIDEAPVVVDKVVAKARAAAKGDTGWLAGRVKDPVEIKTLLGGRKPLEDAKGEAVGFSTGYGFNHKIAEDGAIEITKRVLLDPRAREGHGTPDDATVAAMYQEMRDAVEMVFNEPKHRITVDGVERLVRVKLERIAATDTVMENDSRVEVYGGSGGVNAGQFYVKSGSSKLDRRGRMAVHAHEMGHFVFGLADKYQDHHRSWRRQGGGKINKWLNKMGWLQHKGVSATRKDSQGLHRVADGSLMDGPPSDWRASRHTVEAGESWDHLAAVYGSGIATMAERQGQKLPTKTIKRWFRKDQEVTDFAQALREANPQLRDPSSGKWRDPSPGDVLNMPKLSAVEGAGLTPFDLKQIEWSLGKAGRGGRVNWTMGANAEVDSLASDGRARVAGEKARYENPKLLALEHQVLARRAEVSAAKSTKVGGADPDAKQHVTARTADTPAKGAVAAKGMAPMAAKAPGANEDMPVPTRARKARKASTDEDEDLPGPALTAPKAPESERPGATKILPAMHDGDDRDTWESRGNKVGKIPKRHHDEVPSSDTPTMQIKAFDPKATTPRRSSPTRLAELMSAQDRQVLAAGDTSTAKALFADPVRRRAVQRGVEASEGSKAARRRMMRELLEGFGGDFRAAHESFAHSDSHAVTQALEAHRHRQLGSLMGDLQTAFPGVVVHTASVSEHDPMLRVRLEGEDARLARAYLETTAGFDHGGSLARSLGLDVDTATSGTMPPLMRAGHDDITLDLPEATGPMRSTRRGADDELEITAPIPEVTAPLPTQRTDGAGREVEPSRTRPSGDPTPEQVEAFRRNNMNYDWHEEDVADLLRKRPELREIVADAGLTHEETLALYAYSRQDYADMNRGLRGQDDDAYAEFEAQIAITSSALRKLPAFRGTVFRRAEAGDWLDAYQPGRTVTEKAFCSTSTEYDTMLGSAGEGSVEFVIKSRTGRDITQLSGKGELENEVLFDAATRFTVSERKVDSDGTVVIYMDEVIQPRASIAPPAPEAGAAPAPMAPKGGKKAKKPTPEEMDLDNDDRSSLVSAGLTKKEANRIIAHREMAGGVFDLDEFVALNPNVNAKLLAKLARVSGRQDEAVEATRRIGETEAEAAQRIGLDPLSYGRRHEVQDVAEVHDHFKGVLGSEAWAKLAFPDDYDKDPIDAARKTVELLKGLYTVDDDNHSEGHNEEARDVKGRASTERVLDILDSADAKEDPVRALQRVLTASGEMPFDYTYDPRGLLIKKLQRDGRAEQFVEDTILELKRQGITYAELQGKIETPGVTPEKFAEIGERHGVVIRMLPHLLTHQFAEGGDGFSESKMLELLFGKGAKAEGDVPDMVGGIDICGPESGRWDETGTKRLEDAYKVLQRQALLSDRTLVFRPHVGEGYSGTEGQRRHGVEKGAKQAKIAQDNLDAILTRLEDMQRNKLYAKPPEGKVEVRLGHVTQATATQVARMKALGVVAEVNIGSNLVTGALGKADQPTGSRLDKHPLLTLLYHDVHTILSTDAGGVMSTDLAKEYGFAADILERFRAGETSITVPDPANPKDGMVVRYKDLPSHVQKRFQVEHLERTAQAYARLGRMRHNEEGEVVQQGWKVRTWRKNAGAKVRALKDKWAGTDSEDNALSRNLDDVAPDVYASPEEQLEQLQQTLEELRAMAGAAGTSRSDVRRAMADIREEILKDFERQLRRKHPGATIEQTSAGSDRLDIQIVDTAEPIEASTTLEELGSKMLGETWLKMLGIRLNVPETDGKDRK